MSAALASAVPHLWQSTLVAAAIYLATLVLRRNRARVRYWLWTAASVKFLVPFSWLVSLGAQVEWRGAAPFAQPATAFVMDEILMSPGLVVARSESVGSPSSLWPPMLAFAWVLGSAVVLLWRYRQWRPIRAALLRARPIVLGHEHGLSVVASPSLLEPGVVGIWRPVLVVPEGLADRLTPAQLNAVLTHEQCHIRCHDNLLAAVHMLVEALFWFHPLVWWMEHQLVAERERACDEAVVNAGNDPTAYADGILAVCRFAVRTSFPCVTGVTGSNLRMRLESIVRRDFGTSLTLPRRVALALTVCALVGIPIVAGMVRAEASLLAQTTASRSFEVASVKPNKTGIGGGLMRVALDPGGTLRMNNLSLREIARMAYQVRDEQLVGPDWIRREMFDVIAKGGEGLPPLPPPPMFDSPGHPVFAMLRTLLEERFKIAVHHETRSLSKYALVMLRADGSLGPSIRRSSTDCQAIRSAQGTRPQQSGRAQAAVQGEAPPCGMVGRAGAPVRMIGDSQSMSQISALLASFVDRDIVDRTDLNGLFSFTFEAMPDMQPSVPLGDAPSIFTAVQEQLGFRLEAIREPTDVVVIDHVEQPTPD